MIRPEDTEIHRREPGAFGDAIECAFVKTDGRNLLLELNGKIVTYSGDEIARIVAIYMAMRGLMGQSP